MSLFETLENDLKSAMLSRNKELTDLLRLIKAALKNEMISLKKQKLTDDEIVVVLKREAKKRNDSIEQFKKGGRNDLAAAEQKELEMIKKYLPAEMPPQEVQKIIDQVVSSMNEVAPSQFGQIMGQVMAKVKGRADGTLVSKLVKKTINK